MSDYTPSVAEIREYVETGGEPRPWVELDAEEKARERFRGEAFDRMIKAVRAETVGYVAQIATDTLRMCQAGGVGEKNILPPEKEAGFQLCIDNIANLAESMKGEGQ